MPPRQTTIFWSQVEAERERQRGEWSEMHDDAHSWPEWTGILAGQVGRVIMASGKHWRQRQANPRTMVLGELFNDLQRCSVRISAVCEALWESIERRRDGEIESERQRIEDEQRRATMDASSRPSDDAYPEDDDPRQNLG
jgi:hypothetical protein